MSLPLPPAARDPFPLEELREPLLVMLAPRPRRSWWQEWGRNAALFLLTAISVFLVYGLQVLVTARGVELVVAVAEGLKLVAGVMSIMVAHEMGHYLACRCYRVDATLPFFIPFPVLSPVGTLGAFIRIKSPFPNRKALFDIGIAGPLAGFVACVPVLLLGVLEGNWVPLVNGGEGPGYLGEPLAFQWAVSFLRGSAPDGMTLGIGPLGMAAWFGLFLTALNMMPVGQLDGGHVAHALWPRQAHWISRAGLIACLFLLYLRPTWLVWTLLLWLLGRRPHPPTLADHLPLGRTRLWVGLLGFAIFAVCFTPNTFLVSWSDFLQAVGLTSH